MANERNREETRDNKTEETQNTLKKNADLADSPRDEEKLRSEETVIDMPEVKDIPGQEHVRVPRMREMEDTTISSADEEGEGILDNINEEDDEEQIIKMGTEADTTGPM
jgi:hypothetical protein